MGVATFKDPSTGNTVTKAYIPIGTTISVATLASVPASAARLASGARTHRSSVVTRFHQQGTLATGRTSCQLGEGNP
jgi:hypothetical protein